MKTWVPLAVAAAIVFSPVAGWSDLPVQVKWLGSGGWGYNSAYCSLYDTKTVKSIRGTVITVDTITPMPGMTEGVELQLQTKQGNVSVHLGPRWYVENQDIDLEPKDMVEVTGSFINCAGQRILAAAKIRKGDQVIRLRDAKGIPLWSAWHDEKSK